MKKILKALFRVASSEDSQPKLEALVEANSAFDPDWVLKPGLVTRRVQTISLTDSWRVRVRTSLHIDPPPSMSLADSAYVPMGILHKGLHLEFDLRNERGDAVALAGRQADSELTARCLVRALKAEWQTTPARIRHILKEHVYQMETAAQDTLSNINSRPARSAEEQAWLEHHMSPPSSRFEDLLGALGRHYVPYAHVSRTGSRRILKMARVEDMSDRHFRDTPYPSRYVAVDLPDIGWATSDHVRLVAPPGTIVADTLLVPDEDDSSVTWSEFPIPERAILYIHDKFPVDVTMSASLWPERSGFVSAARVLIAIVVAILFGGAAAELIGQARYCEDILWPSGFVQHQSVDDCERHALLWGADRVADAALALTFLVSTAILAYVYRDDNHAVRSELLGKWKTSAILCIAIMWFACVLLLTPRISLAPYALWSAWSALGVASVVVLVRTELWWRRAVNAQDLVEARYSERQIMQLKVTTGPRSTNP